MENKDKLNIQQAEEKIIDYRPGFLTRIFKFNTVIKNWFLKLLRNISFETASTNDSIKDIEKNIANLSGTINEKLTNLSTTLSNTTSDSNLRIKNLEKIFTNPNSKGKASEQVLEHILENVMGPEGKLWSRQSQVNVGIVDVAIDLPTIDKIIPIDSKIPFDNYKRYINYSEKDDFENAKSSFKSFNSDMKNYIKDIAKKYVDNVVETTDYGFIFIPSESMYYDLITKSQDVLDISNKARVFIVSPSNIIHLINIVDSATRDFAISENINEVVKKVMDIRVEFNRFNERWNKHIDVIKKFNNDIDSSIKNINTTTNKIANGTNTLEELKKIE